jgi:hypothetical protein
LSTHQLAILGKPSPPQPDPATRRYADDGGMDVIFGPIFDYETL